MKKKILGGLGIAAAGLVAAASIASATVTFDPSCSITPGPSSGACGFVGKGDVQIPFGWNNQTAQAQAGNVSFAYNASNTYDVTVEFDTGVGTRGQQHQVVTENKSTAVSSSVASDPRKTGQYTGWKLTGLGAITVSGDTIPAVNDPCPNGGPGSNCIVTAVTLTGSTGGLYASDAATSQGPTLIG